MDGVSKLPKARRGLVMHRYQPKLVGEGSFMSVLPGCSCGWVATNREYNADARSVWKRHVRENEPEND
jgi:hypothetical protein